MVSKKTLQPIEFHKFPTIMNNTYLERKIWKIDEISHI